MHAPANAYACARRLRYAGLSARRLTAPCQHAQADAFACQQRFEPSALAVRRSSCGLTLPHARTAAGGGWVTELAGSDRDDFLKASPEGEVC
jgi:hypothetical protein